MSSRVLSMFSMACNKCVMIVDVVILLVHECPMLGP